MESIGFNFASVGVDVLKWLLSILAITVRLFPYILFIFTVLFFFSFPVFISEGSIQEYQENLLQHIYS